MEKTKPAELRGNKLGYMPQLDSLRTFAVLGVLMHHFLNVETLPWKFLKLPWGHLGVRLFFVLSGFLITGILLKCRDAADASGQRWFFVRQFYIRRFLRIFPLYYSVIIAGFLLNIPPVREVFPWLFTYTTNFYVSAQGHWLPQVGHLWTLAVEEQFYIVWPWLVLFAPRKWLTPAMVGIVLLGPIFRLVAVLNQFNAVATYAIPAACMDTLGMGALLALTVHFCREETAKFLLNKIALPIGLLGAVVLHVLSFVDFEPNTVLLDTALGLLFASLIFSASRGFKGTIGSLLEAKPLVYLGRISYGIYVYHFFTPLFVWPILNRMALGNVQWQLLNFTISTAATLILAMLSWHFFEKPINDLKQFAKYAPKPDLSPTTAAVLKLPNVAE